MKDVLTVEFTIHGIIHHSARIILPISTPAQKSHSEKDSDYKDQSVDEEDMGGDMEEDEEEYDQEEYDYDPTKLIVKMPLSPMSPSGSSSPNPDDVNEEKLKKDKIERRKQMSLKYIEDVRKQALDKILREQSKKPKKKDEAQQSTIAKDQGPFIRYIIGKDGKIKLSFPNGFILPKILTCNDKPKVGIVRQCDICGKNGKYSIKGSKCCCSLGCYKRLKCEL
jgi:hypothetical protein